MKKAILYSCLALVSTPLLAQTKTSDTVLKGTTIEVVQSYKPKVAPMVVKELIPSLPPLDTSRPPMRYEVPQQAINYSYAALPLRPLALGKDTAEKSFPNYVKIGGGNLSTLYIDAAIGGISGSNYSGIIQLHHLSQKGLMASQKTAFSSIEASGNLHTRLFNYQASIKGLRNSYYRYGGFNDPSLPFYAPQLEYTGLSIEVAASNNLSNAAGIDYRPSIRTSFYGRAFKAEEKTFAFSLPVSKKIDESFTASLGLEGTITTKDAVMNIPSFNNNIFQFTPMVRYKGDKLEAFAGLYPTFGQNNTYLLPDLGVKLHSTNGKLQLLAGWQATLRQNTYQELSSYNPYLNLGYFTKQTRADEVYIGGSAGIGNHFTADARVSFSQYQNLALYLNDSTLRKSFYTAYDPKVSSVGVKVALRYNLADEFSIAVHTTLQNYQLSTYRKAYHLPSARVGVALTYKPIKTLVIEGRIEMLDGIYTLDKFQNDMLLKPIVDAGLNVEYNIIPRLSLFISVNNLFNTTYQRWDGYESYGANVFGGFRFKF